jgi:hypothetical protein
VVTGHGLFTKITKITKDLKIPFIMSANIRENLRLVSNIRENPRLVSNIRENPRLVSNIRENPRPVSNIRENPRPVSWSIGVNPRLVDSRVMLPYLRCRTTLVSIRAHKVSPRW